MWIPSIDEEDAQGALRQIYDRAREMYTFVPDAVKVFSLRPEVAAAQESLKLVLLGNASSLGARRADMIGAVVSGLNHCKYCGSAHAGLLMKRGDYQEDEALALFREWRSLDLPPDDRAMLEFAEKLTYAPWSMEAQDVQKLRDIGFSDVNIYDIVMLTAYRNFMNRVNDGLGVPVDRLRGRFGSEFVNAIAASFEDATVREST